VSLAPSAIAALLNSIIAAVATPNRTNMFDLLCCRSRRRRVAQALDGRTARRFPRIFYGQPSGPTPTFASHLGATFANVGVTGPLASYCASGALDLTFA